MKLAHVVLTLALTLFLAVQVGASSKTLRYGGGGEGAVVFDGRMHAGKGYVCNDCHLQLFSTAQQARISMDDHSGDTFCFKCHDNKTASNDCVTCHRKSVS